MRYSRQITDIIELRFSCRTFPDEPLADGALSVLGEAAESLRSGPLGAMLRFRLVAATPEDSAALKGLGTYGTIRGAAGFLIGAAEARGTYLEDYGYALEQLILLATDLHLGTCWLGGGFSRGAFSRRIELSRTERVPAVAAIGLAPADQERARSGLMRVAVGGSRRRPWEELFFEGGAGVPLSRESAGAYGVPLEMVRLGPSASNKQPWRIVRDGRLWHFLLQRTPGYPPRLGASLLRLEDLQRVDMGIAMCHFELSAREQGLDGAWVVRPPSLGDTPMEYVVSWEG